MLLSLPLAVAELRPALEPRALPPLERRPWRQQRARLLVRQPRLIAEALPRALAALAAAAALALAAALAAAALAAAAAAAALAMSVPAWLFLYA